MQITERSFFREADEWLFQRVLRLAVHSPGPEISVVASEGEKAGSALPRPLAVGYSLYLSMVAQRTGLATRIWEAFPEAASGVVRDEHLIFGHRTRYELYIGVGGIFKCCPSLQHLQQWFPEVLRATVTPRHLTLFTADVLLAIADEAVLTLLFRRLPMLWLPTAPTVIAAPAQQGVAYRVARRQQRLLLASPQ